MNYIVISPYYPANFQPFTLALHEQGINVLGIGQEPYEQLNPELKNALTEYYRVNNLEDLDEVKRAVAYLFFKHGPIDRIESHNEYWLENDAALRTQFNVFGAKSDELVKTKLKSEMKKHFVKAGVPVVSGAVVNQAHHIDSAVATIGFPIMAKPDNGVGASGTYKLTNAADVEHFRQNWDGYTSYFFEKFVDSSVIVTYDGLLDSQGNIVFATSLEYIHTPLELALNPKVDNGYIIQKEVEPKLKAYGQAIIKEFGMKERFFHIEFFKENDDYIAIEYNNRPGGGFIVDAYNYAHSIDLYRAYAQIVTGQPFPERHWPSQYSLTTIRRHRHDYVHSEEDIIQRYGYHIKAIEDMPEAFAELQGNRVYMLNADDLDKVQEILAYISQQTS